MVLGEHAVLHGHPAIVTAIEQRITVDLEPHRSGYALVQSSLGKRELRLDNIDDSPPFQFVGAAIREVIQEQSLGLKLTITADMPPDIGFGSSAAVTVATVAALHAILGHERSPASLHEQALHCVRQVQGRGSGADVAASTFGGMLLYRAEPVNIELLTGAAPMTVAWSGSKETTPNVVAMVESQREKDPTRMDALYKTAGELSLQAADAIRSEAWDQLGDIVNAGQEIMAAIGVSNDHLDAVVQRLRRDPEIRGAKISGAGLGDCVMGIGIASGSEWPFQIIPAQVSHQGVFIDNEAMTS